MLRDTVEELLGFVLPLAFYVCLIFGLIAWYRPKSLDRQLVIATCVFLLLSGWVCYDYGRWRFERRKRGLAYGFPDYYLWPLRSEERHPL